VKRKEAEKLVGGLYKVITRTNPQRKSGVVVALRPNEEGRDSRVLVVYTLENLTIPGDFEGHPVEKQDMPPISMRVRNH
jgi:hypothetical protein